MDTATRLFSFHIALIPFGKVCEQLSPFSISLQQRINSRIDWAAKPWYSHRSGRKKASKTYRKLWRRNWPFNRKKTLCETSPNLYQRIFNQWNNTPNNRYTPFIITPADSQNIFSVSSYLVNIFNKSIQINIK